MASIIGVETLQHTNGTTAATIDSSGRILKPVIPYWGLKSQPAAAVAAEGTIIWQERIASVEAVVGDSTGGGVTYNTSNGEVTVPVSGLYQVNVHLNARTNISGTNNVGIEIVVNGAEIEVANYFNESTHTLWNDLSFSTVVNLDANDTIRVDNYYNHAIEVDTGRWGGFSGHLVG